MLEFQSPPHALTHRRPMVVRGTPLAFPSDTLVVAVGDVHGQLSAFQSILELAARITAPVARRVLVLTGDLIDRGPQSLACLELAARAQDFGFDEVVYLPGNHELLMLDALDAFEGDLARHNAALLWQRNGGLETMAEILGANWTAHGLDWPTIAQRITAALPDIGGQPYRTAMRAAPSHLRVGDVLFVHAGYDAREPLYKALGRPQSCHLDHTMTALGVRVCDVHWAWAREVVLYADTPFVDDAGRPLLLVHGHTIVKGAKPEWLRHPNGLLADGMDHAADEGRICIDLGAAHSNPAQGMLGGLVMTAEGYRLLAVPCAR